LKYSINTVCLADMSIEIFKQQVQESCQNLLKSKIKHLIDEEKSAKASAESDTKSSMGDKHETAREMLQQEREQIGKRIAESEKLLIDLLRMNENKKTHLIQPGSLVKCSMGWIYLTVSLGSIHVEDQKVNVISLESPFGKLIANKTKGDEVILNGKKIFIEDVA
jgi:transcription elongation GreA/GreB family factor